MKSLNMIGAGRVGRTLARLWSGKGVYAVGGVLTRSAAGARDAVAYIGAGRPAATLGDMAASDVWMLAAPDSAIGDCAARLAASGRLRPGDVVFHVSGALSSADLQPAAAAGAAVASVHPLKTFADAASAERSFVGTYCAAEGAPAAMAALKPAFEAIGARAFEIDSAQKTVYHAACVVVGNYLTALMEAGLQLFERAGFPRETATPMMEPLARETLDNVFALGPARALTGPIARGDDAVVARQLDALMAADPRTGELYRQLGAVALELARTSGTADAAALARLEALLKPVGRGRADDPRKDS